MAKTKQIPILGSKAIIFRNKYDAWQFRMYVQNACRYVEKSLRVKEQARTEELAEDLYIEKGICTQKMYCTDFYSGVLTEVGW